MCIPLALLGVVGGWSVAGRWGRRVARLVWMLIWVAWYVELLWEREVAAVRGLGFGLLVWDVALVEFVPVWLGGAVYCG